jgi:hypothetical protein
LSVFLYLLAWVSFKVSADSPETIGAMADIQIGRIPTHHEESSIGPLDEKSGVLPIEKEPIQSTIADPGIHDNTDEDANYPHGAKLYTITVAVALSVLLVALASLHHSTYLTIRCQLLIRTG